MTYDLKMTGGGLPAVAANLPEAPAMQDSSPLPVAGPDSFVQGVALPPDAGFQAPPNRLFASSEVIATQSVPVSQTLSLGFEPSRDFPDFPPSIIKIVNAQGAEQIVVLERCPVWQALDVLLGQGFPDHVAGHLFLADQPVVLLARDPDGRVLAFGVLELQAQSPTYFVRVYARNQMDPSCTFKGVFPVLAAYYFQVIRESLLALPNGQPALSGLESFILKAMRTKGQRMGLALPLGPDGIYEGRSYHTEVPAIEARALLELFPFQILERNKQIVTGIDLPYSNNSFSEEERQLLHRLTMPKPVTPSETHVDDRLVDICSALKIIQRFKKQSATGYSQDLLEAVAMVVLQNLTWSLSQTDSWFGIRLLAQRITSLFGPEDRQAMLGVETLCDRIESMAARSPSYRSGQTVFGDEFGTSEICMTPEILADEGSRQELGFQLFLLSRGYPALARTIGADLSRALAHPETRHHATALIQEIEPLHKAYRGRPFMQLPRIARPLIKRVTPLKVGPATIRPLSRLWMPRMTNVRTIFTRPVG